MTYRNGRYECDICYGWSDVGVTFVIPPTAHCRPAGAGHHTALPDIP
ncbi:hypothetical protein ACFYOY_35910 [Streptomyces sp. NPDC007875]